MKITFAGLKEILQMLLSLDPPLYEVEFMSILLLKAQLTNRILRL